jgi:anaerobic magnesium-protoporphyrin IX monomethyl ester cyclase
MFQHVLCVYPYRYDLKTMPFFPPLGLEHIAAVIEPFTHALDVVDLRQEKGQTKDFIRPETDLVCFSINWETNAQFIREEILSVGSKALVVVGGRHATEDPEYWLSQCPNIDILVRSDGEEATEDLCRGLPLEEIAGLSFRRNGHVCHNPNRTLGPVSDTVRPNRSRRRYKYEINFQGLPTGMTIDTLSSSRGCPFNCTFCSFSRNPWGGKRTWSARSPESIVDELAQIDAPIVAFTDDLFTLKIDRVERICDLIIEQGIRKKMIVNARVEIARHPGVLRKMEKAGFLMLMLGVESACDKTLRSMGKGFDTTALQKYFKVLRQSSMFIHGYFIVGNIGESIEEMFRIPTFAHQLGLDTIGLSTLRIGVHSGLEELVASSSGYHVAPNGKVYSDQCTCKQIRELRRQMLKAFYSAPQLLRLLRKGVRNGALRLLPHMLLCLPKISLLLVKQIRKHKVKTMA